MDAVRIISMNKAYGNHIIFDHFSYAFAADKLYAIVGESGCGKSTLLNMIGLLEPVDSGEILLFEKNIHSIYHKQARIILRDTIGFLFQNYALIDELSVKANLMIPLRMRHVCDKEHRIGEALSKVGLANYEDRIVNTLSGGEQQRIALARLLLKPCDLILADEPTGNLDQKNKDIVCSILKELQSRGMTIIMATHDMELASHCDEIVYL